MIDHSIFINDLKRKASLHIEEGPWYLWLIEWVTVKLFTPFTLWPFNLIKITWLKRPIFVPDEGEKHPGYWEYLQDYLFDKIFNGIHEWTRNHKVLISVPLDYDKMEEETPKISRYKWIKEHIEECKEEDESEA